MAWNGLLACLHPPADADYVENFKALADLHLELKRKGPTRSLLLRKSLLEAEIGNHAASRRTAQVAVLMGLHDGEALHRLGVSCLMLAYTETGAMPATQHEDPVGVRPLLEEAVDAFERAVAVNGVDEDSMTILSLAKGLLARCPSDDDLWLALREQTDHGAMRRPPRPLRGPS